MNIDKQLEPGEATKVIRDIIKHSGEIILTSHCKERLLERNLSMHDLLSVLSNGVVNDPPEYNARYNQYRYKVVGQTIDSGEAMAITVIVSHRSVLIVTVY